MTFSNSNSELAIYCFINTNQHQLTQLTIIEFDTNKQLTFQSKLTQFSFQYN